jgi:hypothetical protein
MPGFCQNLIQIIQKEINRNTNNPSEIAMEKTNRNVFPVNNKNSFSKIKSLHIRKQKDNENHCCVKNFEAQK